MLRTFHELEGILHGLHHFSAPREVCQNAQSVQMQKITEIASKAGIDEKYIELYGKTKAKLDLSLLSDLKDKPDGKLVLVTAITPTPAGEGKTTTTIGLADGLKKIGKNVVVALREPSLGPVFGVKGGATGGGYAQGCGEIRYGHLCQDLRPDRCRQDRHHLQQQGPLVLRLYRSLYRRCLVRLRPAGKGGAQYQPCCPAVAEGYAAHPQGEGNDPPLQ